MAAQVGRHAGVFMDGDWNTQKPVTRKISNIFPGATIVALFLAAMLQWAAVLTVCPSVHEMIHHDADDEHHDCAVTLFLAGQVEQALIEPIILGRTELVELLLHRICDAATCEAFFLSRCILEHAPPRRK